MSTSTQGVRVELRSAGRALGRLGLVAAIFGLVMGVAVATWFAANSDDRPVATALVVGVDLDVSVDELGGSVEALYRYGGVVESAVTSQEAETPGPEELRRAVDVSVIAATPVIRVGAHADEPTTAVAYANAIAEALAVTLNEAGGVGTFSVAERADLAGVEIYDEPSIALIGVVSALVGSFASYLVLLFWVRPMYSWRELAAVSRSPLVASIDLRADGPKQLADSMLEISSEWMLIDACSYTIDRLMSALQESRCELQMSKVSPGGSERILDRQPNAAIAVVAGRGASQSLVRKFERIAGERLDATIMLKRS